MFIRATRLLCAALVLFVAAAPLRAVEPLPLAEYGKLPEVESTAISPSGKRIAMVMTNEGRRIVLAIENKAAIRMVVVGDAKVRSIRWVGEDKLLVYTSQTEDLGPNFTTDKAEFPIGRVISMDESEPLGVVFDDNPELVDSIRGSYGIRTINGRHYGYFGAIELERGRRSGGIGTVYRFNHGRPYLYRFDFETMKSEKVDKAAGTNHGSDWLIDAAGEIAFKLDVSYESGKWEIVNARGERIAEGRNDMAAISLVGLGADGTSAIYASRGPETTEWFEIDEDGGAPAQFLPDTAFEDLFFDPATGHLMGYLVEDGDTEQYVFLDETLGRKAERVRQAFADFEASITDFTSDLEDVIVHTSGNGDSGTYYWVNLEASRAEVLAYERDAIKPAHVGAISTFEYVAEDGMELDGILTLPPGIEAKGLPLVLLPHGGPHSSDSPAFDWWAQAFASRGYAVFQPNFRGSTNRDEAFKRAGYGEWGRKMQTDKSDGVVALAHAGIIDAARVCIVGASYGGYAALAGVTVQQGLYRCAVAVAPVSDIEDMYIEDLRAVGGDRTKRTSLLGQLGDKNTWKAVSPLKLADRADAPIMLIHGVDDTVVPFSHSAKMAKALKDAGKLYEMVTLEGEDHWLSLSETRMQMLDAAVRFVEAHNPAG